MEIFEEGLLCARTFITALNNVMLIEINLLYARGLSQNLYNLKVPSKHTKDIML